MSGAAGNLRLVFLLSLPRSGSTLLQRLLAAHPQVHTVAEPWLMLLSGAGLLAWRRRAAKQGAASR